MKWSFTIAKIAGTRVQLHVTFLFFIILIFGQSYLTQGLSESIRATAFLLSVFFCVLLHEFGHVIAALRYGITTPKITLLPFGGLASMTRIPKKPGEELVVALAGPAVNVVIAAILILIQGGLPGWNGMNFTDRLPILDALIWVNLVLVMFNLIPAFPMDGGRVFRALLSYRMSRQRATRLAAEVGRVLAVVGSIWAISTGQIMLFFVAIFVFFAGHGEEVMADEEHLLQGHTAGDAAMSDFQTLEMDNSLKKVVDLIIQGNQESFPVINHAGDCIASLDFQEVVLALRTFGVDALVRDAVGTIPEQIRVETPAYEAYQRLLRSKLSGAAVVDGSGRLVKWLTQKNLAEFMVLESLKNPSSR